MGGVAIMGSTIVGYLVAHLVGSLRHDSGPTASGLLLLFLMLGSGGVGFLDDFIKLRHRRSLGLRARAKFLGQLHGGAALRRRRDDVPEPAAG